MEKLYRDAHAIISQAIKDTLPHEAVRKALQGRSFSGDVDLVAIGKAAWPMAKCAQHILSGKIKSGLVVTKYGHVFGELPGLEIVEAGHPIPDANSLLAGEKALQLANSLGVNDQLIFLVSGGGSALFELPLPGLSLEELSAINRQLLSCGANINEINIIRKRLSAIKGGRFAEAVAPARIFAVVLSDVLGNRLDSIASGPAAPDISTAKDAEAIVDKYALNLSDMACRYLKQETPKIIANVETVLAGSVELLCQSAAKSAASLGYTPYILSTSMDCHAQKAGRYAASLAHQIGHGVYQGPCALILGGETIVHITGEGKGGRNQEIALAAAEGIEGLDNMLLFSFSSDGTDGPTNAAGGVVDGRTAGKLRGKGIYPHSVLANNDSYHALQSVNGLIITGPTGTNVNDVTIILHK